MFDDPNKIFKIPLKEKDGKRVKQLIQYFAQVSSKGGGKVPLDDILILANWQSKKESIRITKQRGDLILKSRKGQMKGTFLNSGQRLREKVSDASMLSPDIIVEKKMGGFYTIKKDQLELSNIQGLAVIKTIGDNLATIKLRIRTVLLTSKTVSLN